MNNTRFSPRLWMRGTWAAIALAGALGATPLQANVINSFELDGNVVFNGAKDDWATVNTGGGSASIVARTGVLADPAPRSIYTTGGSKDYLDLSGALSGAGGWKYKDGSVPPKDDIINAYAAAYNVAGDLVVYAGAERGENSGDAFMGFWFFKNRISLNADGSFSGVHSVGDVLVLANYQNGGLSVSIQVLEWNPAQATINGTLRVLAGDTTTPAKCGAGAPAEYCGITNAAQLPTTPWGSAPRQAEFLEVGINISAVLRNSGSTASACFSTFLAETRSSSSVSATLKDFVIGGFDVCGVRVSKSCDTGSLNANGTSIDYAFSGKISNVGFGSLSGITLTDTPQTTTPAATVGAFSYYKCDASGKPDLTQPLSSASPLAAGADVCYAAAFNTNVNGSTNTIKVVAGTGPGTTTEHTSGVATCPVLQLGTGIIATKSCAAALDGSNGNFLFVRVNVSGTVCNDGAVALTQVSVTDKVPGMTAVNLAVASTTLGPKGTATECTTYSGSYVPIAPDAGTTTRFSDAVSARGVPPPITGKTEVKTMADVGASCNLCPDAQCTAPNGASLTTLLKQQKK